MRLIFDSGTLVLAEAPDADLGDLPGVLWDARVALWRAPARFYGLLTAALRRQGLAFVDEVGKRAAPSEPWHEVELRPYQNAALLSWELAKRRGIVVLPTGSGKTRLALAAMAATGARTLCLVPTRVLVHQWLSAIGQAYAGPIGVWGDGQKRLEAVTVATFEGAYQHMDRLGQHFELLVVDEVHHFGAGIKDEALDMCVAPFRLGLTATLPEERALGRLRHAVGQVVYELCVDDLAGTYLADYDLLVLRLGLEPRERRAYEAERQVFARVYRQFQNLHPGGSWQEFLSAASQSSVGRQAVMAWHESRRILTLTSAKRAMVGLLLDRHRSGKVLIFTADNSAAYAIAREQLVMPITCDIGRRERERALQAFREGALGALVSARVLNEGIDVPDADVAIIVGGTQGEREHVQRIGRLLRPAAGKRATVYELVALATAETRQSAHRRRGLVASQIAGE
ncbi:MAG TPA: DEAD/DEAH box helicase family protein [Polyangiaceae bacterium]|nr:DEAD/DEAH box helicase family protein [Polyangiaceae bacterium]